MNYKKMLSLLLAASMAVSMPINVFAVQPVTETENQTEVTPYLQPDATPPVLQDVIVDKDQQELHPGDTVTITLKATDNSSGITSSMVGFWNNSGSLTGISGEGEEGDPLTVKIEIEEDTPAGHYTLEFVYLDDAAGNRGYYGAGGEGAQPVPGKNPSFTVINDDYTVNDTKAELKSFRIDEDTVTIPKEGKAKLGFDVEIDAPGTWISALSITFRHEDEFKEEIYKQQRFGINPDDFYFEMDRYTVPGTYKLEAIVITTSGKNTVIYKEKLFETDPDDPVTYRTFPEGIDPENIKFTVINPNFNSDDKEAPVLNSFKLENTVVDVTKDYQQVIMSYDVSDEGSGVRNVLPIFKNKENGKEFSEAWYDDNFPNLCYVTISPYEPAGVFDLMQIYVSDNMGNEAVYYTESNPEKPSNALTIEDMSFTVVNNWKETSPTPDPTPSNPDKGTSSNSSSSSSSAVNYESEKPNPADKKAVEAYNFWQNAKAKVRTTPDGKTMRLFVPKDITYMPASMMETLYREKITLIITHNGKKIVIPAGKAMPKQKLKVYWTFESLEKLYQA